MIIVDIDGVVTDNRGITSFKQWERLFPIMEPNQALIELITPNLKHVMFVTGRSEQYRDSTMAWFQVHWPEAIEKSMGFQFRPSDDYRDSSLVKSDLLDRLKEAGYPLPTLAIDDVDSNIEMYRARGIPTMQHLLPDGVNRTDLASPEAT